MSITINTVTNANVFLDGASKLGQASSVELPSLSANMAEHDALGLIGKLEHFAGFEAMEMTITWNAFYPDSLIRLLDPFKDIGLVVYANMDRRNASGLIDQVSVAHSVRGVFKSNGLGSLKQMENVDGVESMLSVHYVKQVVDGVEVLEYDARAQIYRVNGEDVLANYRNNLGL